MQPTFRSHTSYQQITCECDLWKATTLSGGMLAADDLKTMRGCAKSVTPTSQAKELYKSPIEIEACNFEVCTCNVQCLDCTKDTSTTAIRITP